MCFYNNSNEKCYLVHGLFPICVNVCVPIKEDSANVKLCTYLSFTDFMFYSYYFYYSFRVYFSYFYYASHFLSGGGILYKA